MLFLIEKVIIYAIRKLTYFRFYDIVKVYNISGGSKMNTKKIISLILILFVFTVCGFVSIINQRPSFELIKGNNPPVEYSQELLKINLNTANVKEIESLDGIGPSLAMKIVAYRNDTGGFTDISQFLEINGMGEKKLEAIKDDITLD